MRKTILPLALSLFMGFFAAKATAQTEKGSVSLRFLYNLKVPASRGSSNTSIGADYFVRKNLSLGGYASGYLFGSGGHITGGFSAVPTITKYFGDKRFKPYVEGQLLFGMTAVPTYNADGTGKNMTVSSFGAGAGTGFVYFLRKNVALNVGLNYMISSTYWNGTTRPTYLSPNPSQKLGLNVGLRIFLPGKKAGSGEAQQ